MNIQRQEKLTNCIFTTLLSFSIISCMIQNIEYKVSEIYIAIKYDNIGYVYSEESIIAIDGSYFSLRQKAIYDDNGDLQKFILYKPEGKIEYQNEDFKKDKAIIDYSGMPLNQQWVFKDNKLKKDSETVEVQKVNNSLAKSNTGKYFIFYKLRK